MLIEDFNSDRTVNLHDDVDINDLAITVVQYEDELMKLPLINKMVERHALIMLNDKLPELIDRIYKRKTKS